MTKQADTASMEWPILGGLRFFLALVVAGAHLTALKPGGVSLWLGKFSGLAAVMGFLAISGYSIAASLQREGRGFYFRRALRIVPLYIFLLTLSAVIPHLLGNEFRGNSGKLYTAPDLKTFVLNLLFMQGIFAENLSSNPIVWSLPIEVFFYLVAPSLMRLKIHGLGGLIAASGILYVVAVRVYPSEMKYGLATACLGWSWLLGLLARRMIGRRHTFVVVLCAGLVILSLNNRYMLSYWPVTWIVTAGCIEFANRAPYSRNLATMLTQLGDCSYPFYLAHLLVYMVLDVFCSNHSAWVYLLITLFVSSLIDRLYDRPVKRQLRAHFSRRKIEFSTTP